MTWSPFRFSPVVRVCLCLYLFTNICSSVCGLSIFICPLFHHYVGLSATVCWSVCSPIDLCLNVYCRLSVISTVSSFVISGGPMLLYISYLECLLLILSPVFIERLRLRLDLSSAYPHAGSCIAMCNVFMNGTGYLWTSGVSTAGHSVKPHVRSLHYYVASSPHTLPVDFLGKPSLVDWTVCWHCQQRKVVPFSERLHMDSVLFVVSEAVWHMSTAWRLCISGVSCSTMTWAFWPSS